MAERGHARYEADIADVVPEGMIANEIAAGPKIEY